MLQSRFPPVSRPGLHSDALPGENPNQIMNTPAATSPTIDLPPRTWRGWWLAWPKWFRIGCRDFFPKEIFGLIQRTYSTAMEENGAEFSVGINLWTQPVLY